MPGTKPKTRGEVALDMWESKKNMIVKLYQEEGWPVKHVIKRIRTDTFDPTETQLRSRLKKWRVTKLSQERSLINRSACHNDSTHRTDESFDTHIPVFSVGDSEQPETAASRLMKEKEAGSAVIVNHSQAMCTPPVTMPHIVRYSQPPTIPLSHSSVGPQRDIYQGYFATSQYFNVNMSTQNMEEGGAKLDSSQCSASPWHWVPLLDPLQNTGRLSTSIHQPTQALSCYFSSA
ncbi:hypothetical protein BDV33DRAFT_64042 [Aspergillus novoparasiticus]|uniref:Clr5 domain-containing protein n=1 Tax=Aspergillus novoparasiticus TaxID=986946 RepID=A0A5N6E7N2_9EURO|nr:hypothetical protein BDV33DRAFT_64042 [Aspergillus novoparasiticus]